MTKQNSKKNVRYFTWRLNLLQTMGLLALLGLIITVLLNVYLK